MTSPYAHIAAATERVRTSMIEWASGLLSSADLEITVVGGMVELGKKPGLVLLPYQMVMESQPGVPEIPLMPASSDKRGGGIPAAWRTLATGMTDVLVEQFPQRPKKAPGLGPLDPRPLIAQLPKPLAAWYRENESFRLNKDRGRLPQISWRQPFSLVVRYAAMVPEHGAGSDILRLQALSVLAGGIRQERYFQALVPACPQDAALSSLVDAMAASAPEGLRETLQTAAADSRSDFPLAVGLFPHHELTDNDLALVMTALNVPMQPAIVFGARLSLGAGPVLLQGAVPHLGSVDKSEAP